MDHVFYLHRSLDFFIACKNVLILFIFELIGIFLIFNLPNILFVFSRTISHTSLSNMLNIHFYCISKLYEQTITITLSTQLCNPPHVDYRLFGLHLWNNMTSHSQSNQFKSLFKFSRDNKAAGNILFRFIVEIPHFMTKITISFLREVLLYIG